MTEFLEIFNRLYTSVELNSGEYLADSKKIIFPDNVDLKKAKKIECF